MKIAILSDTRLPTHPDFPGHGLGQAAIRIGTGLIRLGHTVTLHAGPGSFLPGAGEPVIADNEATWADLDYSEYYAIIDTSHHHTLSQKHHDLPVLNRSADYEHAPGPNAVFISEYARDKHGYTPENSRVIYNGVDFPSVSDVADERWQSEAPYFAFLAAFYDTKAPVMAYNAARAAGAKLLMAGPIMPPLPDPVPGANWAGQLVGDDKWAFLSNAEALIFCRWDEPAGNAGIEALRVGTPVIHAPQGGFVEYADDTYCQPASDTLELIDILRGWDYSRATHAIRKAAIMSHAELFSIERMAAEYEFALYDIVGGTRW